MTDTVTANGASLKTTALDGQVVSFAGSFVNNGFAGTYSVSSGCDDGDRGSVIVINIYVAGADAWDGTFISSARTTFFVGGDFAQGTTASSDRRQMAEVRVTASIQECAIYVI